MILFLLSACKVKEDVAPGDLNRHIMAISSLTDKTRPVDVYAFAPGGIVRTYMGTKPYSFADSIVTFEENGSNAFTLFDGQVTAWKRDGAPQYGYKIDLKWPAGQSELNGNTSLVLITKSTAVSFIPVFIIAFIQAQIHFRHGLKIKQPVSRELDYVHNLTSPLPTCRHITNSPAVPTRVMKRFSLLWTVNYTSVITMPKTELATAAYSTKPKIRIIVIPIRKISLPAQRCCQA